MGIFNTSILSESFTSEVEDITLDNVEESVHEPNIEGAWAIAYENNLNYNNIMKAVGLNELSYYMETGEEMVYEAVDIKAFFTKVKNFFLSILQKIAGLVKKFIAMFDSWTKSDKGFVDKYKKTLLNAKTTDFRYKGYQFTNLNWNPATAAAAMNKIMPSALSEFQGSLNSSTDVSMFDNINNMDSDAVTKTEDRMRAVSLPGVNLSDIEAGEFAKEIHSYFRNKEDSKEEIDGVSVNEQMNIILGTSTAKKTAETAFKNAKKVINDEIKDLEKVERDLGKKVPDKEEYSNKAFTACSKIIGITKTKLNIMQQVNGGLLSAIKDQNRQAKSICVSLVNYRPKNEGTDMYNYTESGSYLDRVTLI